MAYGIGQQLGNYRLIRYLGRGAFADVYLGEHRYLNSIVPGKHPFEALARLFESYLPEKSVRSIREDLEDDSARGLHLLASQLVKRSAAKVFLVIDIP